MKNRNLDRGDVLPASWTDSIQEFIGTLAANVRLTIFNPTTVRALASAGSGQAALGIGGLWRYRTTNQDVAVSGAAGTYDVFVVTGANDFASTPDPDTDSTDYNWYVQVLASGTTPTGNTPAGDAITAYRKVGELDWSGTAIEGLVQTSGYEDATLPVKPTARHSSESPLRVRGVAGQSAPLIRAGSSADPADRLALAAAGQLQLPVQGNTGGLLIGGDASVHRSAAGVLTVPGALEVTGALTKGTVAVALSTDARFPAGADIVDSDVAAANKDGAAATPSLRTLGAGALQAAPGNDARFTKTFRIGHTFAIAGAVLVEFGNNDYIPQFNVPVAAGQTVKLVAVRYRLRNGGVGQTVSFKVRRNGADIGFGTTAAPLVTPINGTWATHDPADVTLADNDFMEMIVTAIAGTPRDLSVTLIFEHTV